MSSMYLLLESWRRAGGICQRSSSDSQRKEDARGEGGIYRGSTEIIRICGGSSNSNRMATVPEARL